MGIMGGQDSDTEKGQTLQEAAKEIELKGHP